jgi:N-dimethylarginine dimethylaminohydrolase
MNFVELGGMYNYCPRDRLIIAGDRVIDPVMMYPCRDQEIFALDFVCQNARELLYMPRNAGHVMDAANVCRLGDRWIYLESPSGNRSAYEWLCKQLPDIKIELVNFYSGVHIDSTISPLCEGTALINAGRVKPENLPESLKGWDIIWVDNVVERDFYQYPYASKWIGMNVLSIDPRTVVVDKCQKELITILEKKKFTVIPHELRHSRTLGGGYHCVTLDTWRQHD